MKTTSFVLSLIMALAGELTYGQDGDAPEFAVSLKDFGCTTNNCDATTGCSSTTFIVPMTGYYTMNARTYCTGGVSCANCQSCVNIYQGSNFVANCHTAECDAGKCSYACAYPDFQTYLSTGVTYTLYVCLIPCPGGGRDCDDCGQACRAEGCVYLNNTPCPAP